MLRHVDSPFIRVVILIRAIREEWTGVVEVVRNFSTTVKSLRFARRKEVTMGEFVRVTLGAKLL